MGYLNREDKTSEDIDSEGYMCSGDIGSMNKDGYLFITGRIKELLITAGGENVAPVIAEDKIKAELLTYLPLFPSRPKPKGENPTSHTSSNTARKMGCRG